MAGAVKRGLNERALIAEIFAPLAADTPGAFNLRDDAASLSLPAGQDLIVTTDAIIAGVHFLADDPADKIAAKALRVNLSDLAAKGAVPFGYTLTLALNAEVGLDWLKLFARGLKADQEKYGIALYGGDTVRTPGPLSLSITAFGIVEAHRMVQRFGAQAGEVLYVTGTIGDAALGLLIATARNLIPPDFASSEHGQYLLERYRCPQPRCALIPAVSKYATAAMDISDGLVGDIAALVNVSGVSAEIDLENIPLSKAARHLIGTRQDLLKRALTGGDDYEIACTVPSGETADFEALANRSGVAVSKIGVITRGVHAPRVRDKLGNELIFQKLRYEH